MDRQGLRHPDRPRPQHVRQRQRQRPSGRAAPERSTTEGPLDGGRAHLGGTVRLRDLSVDVAAPGARPQRRVRAVHLGGRSGRQPPGDRLRSRPLGCGIRPDERQFVVQPYGTPGNLQRLTTPGGSQTVGFTWRPDEVAFTAGGSSWTYTVTLDPPATGERPHEPLARRRPASRRRQAGRRRRERLHLHAVKSGRAVRRRPRRGSP